MRIIYDDITVVKADVIINAANGIGFMGGLLGRFIPLRGVAESIHYATKGKVEKEARQACRKNKWIPRYFCGHKSGEIYLTGAGSLPAKWIIHAVTMPFPGMKSNLQTIRSLLLKIIEEAKRLGAQSVSLPLLGTGTGGLSKESVLDIYRSFFDKLHDLEIIVVDKG